MNSRDVTNISAIKVSKAANITPVRPVGQQHFPSPLLAPDILYEIYQFLPFWQCIDLWKTCKLFSKFTTPAIQYDLEFRDRFENQTAIIQQLQRDLHALQRNIGNKDVLIRNLQRDTRGLRKDLNDKDVQIFALIIVLISTTMAFLAASMAFVTALRR